MSALKSFTVLLAILSIHVSAALRMPEIFNDHMVLQQEEPIAVWGWANAGETVKVTVDSATLEAKAGTDGAWKLTFPALKSAASQGKAIQFEVQAGGETVSYKNVVVGEVWLASGQSNMNRPVNAQAIKEANLPDIRLITTNGSIPRRDRLNDVTGWMPCTPETIAICGDIVNKEKKERRPFSEVAFHFARKLHQELKVPIGIIHTSTGGSTAKDWIPNPNIGTQYPFDQDPGDPRHKFGILYQAKLHAMIPFAIKGVVWYQGEDDGRNGKYADDMKALIEAWRAAWNKPELPFYMVQIAQTTYAGGMLGVWEAQSWTMNHIKHTGLIPSNDIYENGPGNFKPDNTDKRTGWPLAGNSNPHPPNRPLVAIRLAGVALTEVYGQRFGEVYGPMYQEHTVNGDKIIVKFKYAGEGLASNDNAPLTWFELSADGQNYAKASAEITGKDTVTVSSPEVPQPKFVRFGWHALVRHNLINKKGLPAVSFRAGPK